MATILIAEDRDVDRQYLATLLGYFGHRVVESRDGSEALAQMTIARPDLVISDVLMPTMDGFEFVRRMRELPDVASTRVMFYTASYHERDARRLAAKCGVTDVLVKPSEPEVIMAKVNAVLGRPSVQGKLPDDDSFNHDHIRVVNDRLLEKVQDLKASEQRLTAVVELCRLFTELTQAHGILEAVCTAAREVTLAQHAVVGVVDDGCTAVVDFATSGAVAEGIRNVAASMLHGRILGPVLERRVPVRLTNPGGRPEAIGMPATHPCLSSYLAVPIASATRVYGWIGLRNKLGADAFTERDEQVASMIGLQAGLAYENARLVEGLRQRTDELQAAEARTAFALDAACAGLFDADLAAGTISWSAAAAAIFGVPAGTFPIEEAIDRLVSPDDQPELRRALQASIAVGAPVALEMRTIGQPLAPRWLDVRGRISTDASGTANRLLGVAIDVTARKSLEAQFRQSQKLESIALLAGGVAHDFNNLLTVIRGHAEFLSEDVTAPAQRSDTEEILIATDRAAALTRQLLAFSRQQVLQRTIVDLNDQVGKIEKMLQRLIGERIELVTALTPDLASLRVDAMQMDQVIMNLVVNARDAMPDGGRICIETADVVLADPDALGEGPVKPGSYVRLTVSDTGTGMSDDTRARLFEPFFTTKARGKGTGLGLSTVHGIVTQSDGYIRVHTAPGRGTTFNVYLPVASGEAAKPSVVASSRPLAGTACVLLVEDQASVREVTERILQRAGYSVFTADTAERARTIYSQQPIDLLLTDVVMPGSTGPALYGELIAASPALRVLYMSGYTDTNIAPPGAIDFDASFIQKPFSADSLARKVHEVLQR